MKKLLLVLLLFSAISIHADNIAMVVTGGSASNLVAKPLITDDIIVTATTTNLTTVKFYDSATTTTNYVQGAYTKYASYATNFDVVFTNEAGILVTNTFKGIYTGPTSVSASTSSIPAIQTIIVPASTSRTKVVHMQVMRGLTVVPNNDVIVEVDYRNNP